MKEEQKYHVAFFAGGETRDNLFNIFTGSFIKFLSQLFEENFTLVKDIYFRLPMFNVIWALNNAQKPIENPGKDKIITSAFKQLVCERNNSSDILIILSSSSGGIVAAQTACYLAQENIRNRYYLNSFHVAIGTSLISKKSDLFQKLLEYQSKGIIGKIIFDDIHDKEDSVNGVGGQSRGEAWSNAFGLMFPYFSKRFTRPSFLNTDYEKGHFHRRRSQTVRKAKDFIEVIFIRNKIAGEKYCEKAAALIGVEDGIVQNTII
jgi:hypothetical protein